MFIMCTAEKDDPSQKSSAIRARRKRDTRRSTGKITFDDVSFLFSVSCLGIILTDCSAC